MKNVLVEKERHSLPYLLPFGAAAHFALQIDEKDYVSWYDLIASEMLAAIALEATLNTFGHFWIDDFEDFESSRPVAKLRIICDFADIEYSKSKKPFNDLRALLKARNKIAHPKYRSIKKILGPMSLEKAQRQQSDEIQSDMEKQLSPEIAKRSIVAVKKFIEMLQDVARERGDNELLIQSSGSKILHLDEDA